MDKAVIKSFRADFADVVKSLEEKYDAQISLGNVRYSPNDFTSKITFTEKPKNGKSIEQAEFEKHCKRFGLEPSDLGKKFHGGKYTLTGLNPNRPKYPVSGISARGARYKFGRHVLNDLE